MSDSDPNTPNVADPELPSLPPPPGNGNGNGNGHPPAITVTRISPIAGALAGGTEVTISGTGFQAGAEVFFGTTASANVQVQSSTQAIATAPAGTQTGTEPVSVVNPDGSHGQLTNGFTYFSANPSDAAQVLGVEPANIIEDTDSQITIRGRNLIAAHENGLVALRGPARAAISVSGFSSSRDDASGIETLACTVRVVATPPLAAAERMAIQVLAAVRPDAQTDGVVESSREMFVVLPKTIPVMLAYTANVDPAKPNLVMVTGRNLEGCSLDLGANATVHAQRSDDEFVAALVSYSDGAPPPQFAVQADGGGEVARLEMSVATPANMNAAAPAEGGGQADLAIEPGGDPGDGGGVPGLTPVPGQQVVGPTAQSSTVVNLSGQVLGSFTFDWSSFAVSLFTISFRLRIANFIKVVPFFDGGGEEVNSPVLAKVGHLMPLRGMGILVALRVEITVSIRLLIIISWKHGFDFGPWNEFSDFGFGLGSLVIGFELDIDIDIEIFFMVALVLPDGSLKVLEVFDFDVDFHFQISADLHSLKFNNFKHKVHKRRIGPLAGNPFACDGRFQLADDNGQTSFTDQFGADLSFYFVRGPGHCCLSWNFDLDLIRFTDDGPEISIQPSFDVDYCLNALDSSNQNNVIVVSDQCPTGRPCEEKLTVADPDKGDDSLRAMFQPIDTSGAAAPQDVRDFGYRPLFYLADKSNEVVDSDTLPDGLAIATKAGSNTFLVKLPEVDVTVIDTGIEAPSFWPDAVTGFDILSFLARGLAPALLFEGEDRGLPVTVDLMAAPGTITVSLTLAYYDQNVLKEAKQGNSLTLERNEPFETQREYVLAARISANQVQFPQTLKVTSKNPRVGLPLAGIGFQNPRGGANSAKQFFEGELANDASSGSSLTFTVTESMIGKLVAIGAQDPNGAHLKVTPHNKEEGGTKFVPPGKAVRGNDTTLTIDFDVKIEGSSTAQVQLSKPSLTLIVSNDETFEEYLRVFQEVTDILNGPGSDGFFRGFDAAFYNELKSKGATAAVLNEQGKELWEHAWQNVGTLKDDRPLYWTRLRAIAALRAFAKRQTPPITGATLDNLIKQFEWPSRGLQPTGEIVFTPPSFGARTAVITGFDPFGLEPEPGASNPSGLFALWINQKVLGSMPPVTINAAVFPVRFGDFNAGIVENAFPKTVLASIAMLMTISQNGLQDFYDVERWAARNRAPGSDNNDQSASPVVIPAGDEFLESTLPFARVITSAEEVQGPSEKRKAPFVIDQGYSIAGQDSVSINRKDPPDKPKDRVKADPPKFRPSPLLDDEDQAAFLVKPDHPDNSKTSKEGSGSNFLSNEIFYRATLLRNADKPTLASGHLHIPPFVKAKATNTLDAQRDRLLNGTKSIVERFLAKVALPPEITSFSPITGPTGTRVTILGSNFTDTLAVLIGGGEVDFLVERDDKIIATVTFDATTGPIQVQTPNGTTISEHFFTVTRRPRRGDLGAELLAKRTELSLTPKVAAQQIGVSASTYRRWEQGKDRPSARYHSAVVNFLGHDPDRDPKEFGQRIREARERDGLTRSQLAAQIGVASSTVKAWENGTVTRPNARVEGIFEDYLNEN